MPTVAELELYELPITEQHFANDPNPHMIAAREVHPWLARSKVGYVLTDYAAIYDIMGRDDVLKTPCEHVIQIMGGEGTNWARFERELLIATDAEKHERIRSAANPAFLPKAVNSYRERVQKVITQLLDEWAPKGRFDFEDFASRFPIAVTYGLLGIPRERIEDMKYWMEMLGQSYSLNPEIFPEIDAAFNGLWDFAEGLVAERKAKGNPGEPDVLDALIAAEAKGVISATERTDLILFMFAGGYDTSKNELGHIMNLMLDRPEMWERCAVDRKFCDDVTEEAMRHSGVSTSYRNVATEFEYRGVTFPPGTMLVFPLGIVCRFSGPFEDPMDFQPGRVNGKRHTLFGRGIHICLGQFLARLMIAEGIHMMAQRLKNPRRDGPTEWRLFPGVWGPKRLPIAFEPAVVIEPAE